VFDFRFFGDIFSISILQKVMAEADKSVEIRLAYYLSPFLHLSRVDPRGDLKSSCPRKYIKIVDREVFQKMST
jgi:hypothetical protein